MLEQAHAQVAHHALLDRNAPDRRGVGEGVLEHQRREQHQHDVAERGLRRSRGEQGAEHGGEDAVHRRAADALQGLLAEQGAQERDQQHEGGPVQHGGHERGRHVGDEQEGVRTEQPQQAGAAAHVSAAAV